MPDQEGAAPAARPPKPPRVGDGDHAKLLTELGPMLAKSRAEREASSNDTPSQERSSEREPEAEGAGDDQGAGDQAGDDDQVDEAEGEGAGDDAGGEGEGEGEGDEGAGDDKPVDPKTDPKTARGLEAVHRAETKFKKEKAAALADLQRQRTEVQTLHQQAISAQKEVDSFKARFRNDPVGAALALKLIEEDDFEHVGKQFYYRSKAVASKPEYRDQAERDKRERETSSKSDEALRRAEAAEKRAEEAEHRLAFQGQLREYMGTVEGAASDETPLVKRALAKNPKKIRAELEETAHRLAKEKQVPWPEPEDVVAAWEAQEHARLVDLDIDPSKLTGAKPGASNNSKTKTPVAGESKRPKTLSNDLGTSTKPRSTPKSREEEIAEVERDLKAGRHRPVARDD